MSNLLLQRPPIQDQCLFRGPATLDWLSCLLISSIATFYLLSIRESANMIYCQTHQQGYLMHPTVFEIGSEHRRF